MIKAPSPSSSVHRRRYKSSSTGTRNASVLPLPVFAAPRQSAPFRASGMALACISVSVLKCEPSRPDDVGRDRGKSENEVNVASFGSYDTALDMSSEVS